MTKGQELTIAAMPVDCEDGANTMKERRKYTFSIDAPECRSCSYYNDCKNKRRVACIYLEPLTSSLAERLTQPIVADVMTKHDYRHVKIGENTTITINLEEVKKKMQEDFYKAIGCPFAGGA